jgi:RNA polymerase primary sigma factor
MKTVGEQASETGSKARRSVDGASRWTYTGSGEQLSASVEKRLAQRAQQGDRAAFERMVNANVPLVVSIAGQFGSAHMESDDLVQEGMIGLCVAIERFDGTRGFRFSTYATYWIRQRILRSLDRHSRMIRLPVDVGGAVRKVEGARERLEVEFGREPTVDELAAECGISSARLQSVLACLDEPLSLDAPVLGESDLTLDVADSDSPAPDAGIMAAEQRRQLDELLGALSARDRLVVEARLGLRGDVVPLGDLADQLRITKEGVRQIQRRALLKLRRLWPESQQMVAA